MKLIEKLKDLLHIGMFIKRISLEYYFYLSIL